VIVGYMDNPFKHSRRTWTQLLQLISSTCASMWYNPAIATKRCLGSSSACSVLWKIGSDPRTVLYRCGADVLSCGEETAK
jgi:hypothetical protein